MSFSFNTIAIAHSCFKQKFGIPRQSGLIKNACAKIELIYPYNKPETVEGLSEFSHIWICFIFHQHLEADWKPTIRPSECDILVFANDH